MKERPRDNAGVDLAGLGLFREMCSKSAPQGRLGRCTDELGIDRGPMPGNASSAANRSWSAADLASPSRMVYKPRRSAVPRNQKPGECMNPRARFVALLAALVCWGGFQVDSSRADDPSSINGGGVSPTLDLKKQLELGLRARRDVEFEYIEKIIKLVEKGTLPRKLVDSTFIWARNMPTRQLQYFQFALRARAKKLGIKDKAITDLSDQAVGVFPTGS
jgi:hypothetical protein